MEISARDFRFSELISVKGRVDQSNADQITAAVEAAHQRGKYNLVIDLGELEYMSSAGFRALLVGQRNCKRYNRGEIILAAVPKRIHEAFELTGFTPLFKFIDDDITAVGYF